MSETIEIASLLEEKAKSIGATVKRYSSGAVNVIIPDGGNGKPLTIMTPADRPLMANIALAGKMLEEHIANSKQ